MKSEAHLRSGRPDNSKVSTFESIERRFASGDMDAFREIMALYSGGIYQFGLRLFLNREYAVEFCQDVFTKVYEKRLRYNPDLPVKPWLYQIAVNTGRDEIYKKREKSVHIGKIAGGQVDERANAPHQNQELKRKIWLAAGRLCSNDREILALRFSANLGLSGIAALLGISSETARDRLSGAVKVFEEAFWAGGGADVV